MCYDIYIRIVIQRMQSFSLLYFCILSKYLTMKQPIFIDIKEILNATNPLIPIRIKDSGTRIDYRG
jgi:hypothetical protein